MGSLVSYLGSTRKVILVRRFIIGYITFELPTDCEAMYTEGSGNLALVMACIEQGFDLMTIFYAELGIFLHDNTNITRLAEDLRGILLRSFLVLHLLLELRMLFLSASSKVKFRGSSGIRPFYRKIGARIPPLSRSYHFYSVVRNILYLKLSGIIFFFNRKIPE